MVETVGVTNPIKKVVSMGDRRYNSQKTIEDEENELKELIKEQKAETSSDNAQSSEAMEAANPEEKTFKKRYGDLRRHAQKQQEDNENKILALQEQLDTVTKPQIKLPKSLDYGIVGFSVFHFFFRQLL